MDGMLATSTATITVTVNDVGPTFSASIFTFSIDVGHDRLAPVGSVSASSASAVTYSVVPASGPYQDADKFTVDETTGEIIAGEDLFFDNPIPGTPDESIIPPVEYEFLVLAADEDGETKTATVKVEPLTARFVVDNVFTIARSSPRNQAVIQGRLEYENKFIAKPGNVVTYEITNKEPPGGNNPVAPIGDNIPRSAFVVVLLGYEAHQAQRFEIRINDKSKIDFSRNDYTFSLRAKFRSADMIARQNAMNPPKRIFQELGQRDVVVPINGNLENIVPEDGPAHPIALLGHLEIKPDELAMAGAVTLEEKADEIDRRIDEAVTLDRFYSPNTQNLNSGYHIIGARRRQATGPNQTIDANHNLDGVDGISGIAVVWDISATRTADMQHYDFSGVRIRVLPWFAVLEDNPDKAQIRHKEGSNTVSVRGLRNTKAHELAHLYGLNVMTTFERLLAEKGKPKVRITHSRRKLGMQPAAKAAIDVIRRQLATVLPNPNDTSDAEATARAAAIVNQNLSGVVDAIVVEGGWHVGDFPGYYMYNDTSRNPFLPWHRP